MNTPKAALYGSCICAKMTGISLPIPAKMDLFCVREQGKKEKGRVEYRPGLLISTTNSQQNRIGNKDFSATPVVSSVLRGVFVCVGVGECTVCGPWVVIFPLLNMATGHLVNWSLQGGNSSIKKVYVRLLCWWRYFLISATPSQSDILHSQSGAESAGCISAQLLWQRPGGVRDAQQ